MLFTYFSILFLSLSLITVLIIVGSIASRKWQFNFAYISLISVAIYLTTSYWATSLINSTAGITIVGLIGLFEATIGLKLAQKLKANLEEEVHEILDSNTSLTVYLVLSMVLVYLFIGWIGTLFV